jgi:hypothetical protein
MNQENAKTDQNYKFRGGTRIGILISTWPNGMLEISQDSLILRDELMKKELKFSKGEIVRIEIKKIFPIIGCGILIHHNNNCYDKYVYFGYLSFRMDKLLDALKKCGWIK